MIDFNNQVPSEIKILILSAISIQKYQIDHLLKCHNLLKLDLSCNAITNLPSFHKLTSLRILYLHQNQLKSIEPIAKLKLNYLTLFLNPISAQVSLRRQIIQSNKQLWALDFNAVTDEERYKELHLKSNKDKSRIPWPIVSLKQEISEPNQLILVFYQELDVIRRIYEKCSVILLIQKFIRRYLGRKRFRELLNKHMRIKVAVVQWKRYTHNKRDLNSMMALQYQQQFDKVKNMVKAYRQKKGKSIKELRCARLILKVLLDYRKTTNGIMKSIEFGQNYKLYFHKDQLDLFRQLLAQIEQKYIKCSQDHIWITQIRQQQNIKYEDFQKVNIIYNSEVFTYRLPGQLQLQLNNAYKKNMITYPATLSKISYCLMSVQLGIVRRWKLVSKFQGLNHLYPYIQQYEEQMPQRKSYFRQFKFNQEEKLRFRKSFQTINKFQMREYRQLLVISMNRELCKEMVKQIIFHNNSNSDNYFIVYFEKQLRQVTATLKIQRKYRAYRDVRQNGQTISQVINKLKQERCIMILQKWFRNIKYCHRNDFFKIIAHRIKQINSKIMFIPLHIYIYLDNIKQQLKFREMNGQLCKNQYDCFMKIDDINILKIFSYLIKSPTWIDKQQNCDNTQQCDIYNLIHYYSECSFITYKQESWMVIIFQDIDMARNRLLLLALQTYRFRYQTYIEMYQQTEMSDINLSKIEQIYQITTKERSMDVRIPYGKIIWLSDSSISEREQQISLKFYRNNLNNKIKRNISKYPQCFAENVQLFYQLYFPIQQISQITKQTEHNITAVTGFKNVQIPENNLLQQMQHQESFEKEHLNKLIKQSTNPSRQCYRNKSVSTKYTNCKTDIIIRQQLQLQQQVQKSSSFHYSTDQELERIKRLRENQQERLQQEKIERVKQFKEGYQSQKLEKSFELGFTTGQNVISRQADRHKFKVQIRSNIATLRQQVQLRQEQNKQIYEQPKKQKKIIHQEYSYIYPEDNVIVRNRWERDKQERKTNKYIHSVLPEELYPLRIEFINEG